MSEPKTAMDVASIKQSCRRLHMPTVAGQCVRLAEQAIKEKRSHLAFLEALLEAEVEEREKNVVARRLKDAHFPKAEAGRRRLSDPHRAGDFSGRHRDR
jgi:DNA replication protein DnaC